MSGTTPTPDQDAPRQDDPIPVAPSSSDTSAGDVEEAITPDRGVATRPATGDADPDDPTKPGTPAYAQRINQVKARAKLAED